MVFILMSSSQLACHPELAKGLETFVGIDVHKGDVMVGVRPTGATRRFAQTPQGHQRVRRFLEDLQPVRIAVEATGGYQRDLVAILQDSGLPVRLVNPRQVHHFATAMARPAKTDPIDALILAHFAEVATLPEPVQRSTNERTLQALVERRRQLQRMRVAEKNRRDHVTPQTQDSLQRTLDFLDQELVRIDAEINELSGQDQALQHKQEIMQSVPGIGSIVARTLCAEAPELGAISGRQAAALGGVAPDTIESGTTRRNGSIHGGRTAVRSALYMAVLSAIRCNPVIRAFYQRLIDNGKPPKVAIIACCRKLLVMVNAMVRDDQRWNPEGPNA